MHYIVMICIEMRRIWEWTNGSRRISDYPIQLRWIEFMNYEWGKSCSFIILRRYDKMQMKQINIAIPLLRKQWVARNLHWVSIFSVRVIIRSTRLSDSLSLPAMSIGQTYKSTDGPPIGLSISLTFCGKPPFILLVHSRRTVALHSLVRNKLF